MLKLENVSFAYENGEQVLENISFTAKRGENISIIGESGCGKSTLLQLIYGLLHTEGNVFWGEQELLGPNFNLVPGEDFIKYLAQDFDLMLPLSVADNVGKYLSNMYPVKKKKRIEELLEVVEMEDMANKKTKLLSGGQQQRVALARALAKEPEMVLLDEPFSHIDHFRKNNLRRKVFKYLKEQNITCIIATHDITDALSFADTTMVLKDHKIYAKASPEDLYNNPPNKYVASLFGDVNELMLKDIMQSAPSKEKIILYPEEIKVSQKSPIKATVIASYFKGSNYLIEANLNGKIVFAEHNAAIPAGAPVFLQISKPLIEKRKK